MNNLMQKIAEDAFLDELKKIAAAFTSQNTYTGQVTKYPGTMDLYTSLHSNLPPLSSPETSKKFFSSYNKGIQAKQIVPRQISWSFSKSVPKAGLFGKVLNYV